ncbi:porin OmpA [Orbaceae bacterium ESL0727]|nr:porin OmpA [Orbaceae bacterium ESL0727]
MKKTTLALAIAVAGLTVSAAAQAAYEDNTFYTGAKIGWSKFVDVKSEKVDETSSVSRDNVGGGAFLGFQANQYLAAELGYDWLGTLKYKSHENSDSKLTVQGVSFTGKASYPLSFITDDLDAYARAGAFVRIAKWKDGVDGGSHTDTGVAPVYALGLDYRLDEDFSTRLEYQWVNNIGSDAPARPDNGMLSLGITYRLGSPAQAPAPAPAPVEVKTQENRYVLNEDVLFAYAKADLKDEGRQALDNLVTTLVKINPTQSTIIVVGHTDRIGSDSYNQKLSEQRANSVMKYLVSKGVPSDLISARGMGKAQPVTGDKCKALRGAELKACLAPDRRVEIEVKARNVQEVKVQAPAAK